MKEGRASGKEGICEFDALTCHASAHYSEVALQSPLFECEEMPKIYDPQMQVTEEDFHMPQPQLHKAASKGPAAFGRESEVQDTTVANCEQEPPIQPIENGTLVPVAKEIKAAIKDMWKSVRTCPADPYRRLDCRGASTSTL